MRFSACIFSVLANFLLVTAVSAAVANIEEEDGSPSCYGWKLKVSNGALTDNGDATCSVVTGTGDITAVGDCATGACFDGSSGTTLTFNDAAGDQTLLYNSGGDLDFHFSDDLEITDATPHLRFTDSTASEDDYEFYADNNQLYLTNVTDGAQIFRADANNRFRVDDPTFIVDSVNNRVGIGTEAPGTIVDIVQAANAAGLVRFTNTTAGTAASAGVRVVQDESAGATFRVFSASFTTSALNIADAAQIRADGGLAGGMVFTTGGSTPLIFGTNDTERMRIDGTGVGIGTSAPEFALDVSGTRMQHRVSTGGVLELRREDTTITAGETLGRVRFTGDDASAVRTIGAEIRSEADAAWASGDTPGRLSFWTTTDGTETLTERMRIDNAGNVGIGTTGPESLLEVQGAEATDAIVTLDADDGDDAADTWFIESEAADNDLSIVNGTTEIAKLSSAGDLTVNGDADLQDDTPHLAFVDTDAGARDWELDGSDNQFIVWDKTNSQAVITIDADRQVGIGTTNPTTLLTLAGNNAIGVATNAASDNAYLAFAGSGAWDSARGATASFYGINHASTPGDLNLSAGNSAGVINLKTAGNSRLYILNNGNVGIGTTGPGAKLDVASGGLSLMIGADNSATTRTDATQKIGRIVGYHYTNSEEPLAGIRLDSGSTWGIVDIGGGSSTTNAATAVRFWTAANSTTVTGTEQMRITSTGNVGIGTSSPESLLEVQGAEATDAILTLDADDGDDVADTWFLESEAADNDLSFVNGVTEVMKLSSAGALVVSGLTTANANLTVGNGATTAGVLALNEDTDDGSNFASFQVPALAANTVYTLPANDGDASQFLQTNGSGTLSWAAASGSAPVSNLVTFSRTAAAGSGAQGVTGMGFAPTSLWTHCGNTGTAEIGSWGFGDDDADEMTLISSSAATTQVDTSNMITMSGNGGTDIMQAVLTSLDADGFTITWTKTGAGWDVTCVTLGLK